jgi:hypothetical protein
VYRAYKRKSKVIYKKKVYKGKDTFSISDRWWICMTHPDEVDKDGNPKPQGFCEVSLEILPKSMAVETPNGSGRDQPN